MSPDDGHDAQREHGEDLGQVHWPKARRTFGGPVELQAGTAEKVKRRDDESATAMPWSLAQAWLADKEQA